MKTIVLVVLLLVYVVLTATTPTVKDLVGKENVEQQNSVEKKCVKFASNNKDCLQYQTIVCSYVSKCTKAQEVCAEEVVKGQECAKWGTETVNEKKKVCKSLEVLDKYDLNKCYKCAQYGEEDIPVKKDKCLEYKPTKVCIRYTAKCSEYQMLKRCTTQVNDLELEGPTTCPANQQLKFSRNGNTITRTCGPITASATKSCVGNADPHMVSDNGQAFEFQKAGDYVFMATTDGVFQVHIRLTSFGAWAGVTAFAARVNGRDIIEYSPGKLIVNTKTTSFGANGVAVNLAEGGYYKKTGNVVEVGGPNGAKFTFTEQGSWGNIVGSHPANVDLTGVCRGAVSTSASGLFGYQYRSTIMPDSVIPNTFKSEQDKQNAMTLCKNRNMGTGEALERCLFDYLNTPAGERRDVMNTEQKTIKG